MFEHTKGLKEVDMSGCEEIIGKKFLRKFFADQSSQNFAVIFLNLQALSPAHSFESSATSDTDPDETVSTCQGAESSPSLLTYPTSLISQVSI